MESKYNEYEEYKNNSDDDYIRQPDPIKVERLINNDDDYKYNNIGLTEMINNNYDNNNNNNEDFDPESIYMKELNDILELSKIEFEQIEIPRQNQIKEKLEIINKINIKINKLLSFDKDNQYYYEMILTVLEMYSNNYIEIYQLNEVEKGEIFKLLKQIRLTKEEFDLLIEIIQ
jgi:hypothetical protein